MKQKNNKSDLATKDFVRKEFKKFESKMDQKLTGLEIGTDIKITRLERRIDDKAQKYRDEILTSNDRLAKQLEEMRDENTIGFNQTARFQKQVDNHETRIRKIEQIQQSA